MVSPKNTKRHWSSEYNIKTACIGLYKKKNATLNMDKCLSHETLTFYFHRCFTGLHKKQYHRLSFTLKT